MKKNVLVICIVMCMMVALAWFSQLSNAINTETKFKDNIKQAENYKDAGLYQKAILAYDEALKLKEDVTIRKNYVEASELAFGAGDITDTEFAKNIVKACEIHPENVLFREKLISHYIEEQNYRKAYEAYKDCLKDDIKSEVIDSLGIKARYAYSIGGAVYKGYVASPNGYATITDGENWGVLDPSGDRIFDCDYVYISPYNINSDALYVTEDFSKVINEDGIVESILKENITKSGAYGNGYLPVCGEDDKWSFLNCETGEYEFGKHDLVSNFNDDIAAVCDNGKWKLINKENKEVSKTVFDDIKLHDNGDYVYKGVMIASTNGKYGIYDEKGNALCKFTAKDMDAYHGGAIAYCNDNGKWGYVTSKGEVTIEPQYEDAKSYSWDLAAVSMSGKWGFINKDNVLVIENQFVDVSYFSDKGVCIAALFEEQYNLIKMKFLK